MKRNEYVLPNGETIVARDSYQGRYIAWPIAIEYLAEEDKKDNKRLESWDNVDCKKIEKHHTLVNKETMKHREAIKTYVLAEKKDWNDHYKEFEYYTSEHARNCRYKTIAEVILQDEEYKRRILLEWEGPMSLYSVISNLEDYLWEEINENKEKHFVKECDEYSDGEITLEFYTDDGEFADIDIRDPYHLVNMVVSVKVIDFEQEILN